MNIDDKIKHSLESEAKSLDKILAHEPGIFKMLINAFKGSLGRWMILVAIVTFLATLAMLWAGYQFFFVEVSSQALTLHKIQWGVILLLSTLVQITLKMWTFMEMNRQSAIREIKRLELVIEKLTDKLDI